MRKWPWAVAGLVMTAGLSWHLLTVSADDSSSSSDSNEAKTNQWLTSNSSSKPVKSSMKSKTSSASSVKPKVEPAKEVSDAVKTKSSSSSSAHKAAASSSHVDATSNNSSTAATSSDTSHVKPTLSVAQLNLTQYLSQLTSGQTPMFLKTTINGSTIAVQLNVDQTNRLDPDDLKMILGDVADNLKAKSSHRQAVTTVKFVDSQQNTLQKF